MAWTPPSDAVAATATSASAPTTGWAPPSDALAAGAPETPVEPTIKPGFFEQLKKSFVDVGIPQAQAGLQGLTVVAQGDQIAKTANRLKGLEAKGEGESKEAQGLRKTLDFYTNRQGRYFQDLASKQVELSKAPTYSGVRKLSEAKTFSEGFKTFAEDPVNIVANLTAQSLPTAIPGLIAGVINPTLGAIVLGGSSTGVEFGSSFLEFARDNGVDTTDPKQMAALFENKELLREGINKAGTRAGIVGAGDLFLAGLASKTLVPKKITGTAAKNITNVAAQLGAQSIGGGGFEAAAQLATEGKVSKPGEVLAETFGGLGTAPLEVYSQTRQAAREAKKAQAKQATERIEPTLLDKLAEDEDVGRPDELTGGAGAGVAGGPGVPQPTRRANKPVADGMVPAGSDVGLSDVGKAAVAPALTEDFRRQYNDLRSEMLELMNLTRPTPAEMNRMKMVQQDLTQLIKDNSSAITAATGNREFTEFHGRDNKQPPRLTNPLFDGDKIFADIELANEVGSNVGSEASTAPSLEDLTTEFMDQGLSEDEARVQAQLYLERGKARGMAGDLFGGRRDMLDLPNRALAISGQDPAKAESYLQNLLVRAQELAPTHSQDSNWGRRFAPTVGMTGQEGFFDPAKVAELFLQKQQQEIADAIEAVRGKAEPRAMQGNLFAQQEAEAQQARETELQRLRDAEKAEREQKKAEEEFLGRESDAADAAEAASVATEETPAEAPVEAAQPTKAEPAKAPPIDTEHAQQTEEGQAILGFFDAVQPASESASEQEKHSFPKNTAANTLLEYDLAKPGETTTLGLQTALRYLANRVGGMDAFRELVTALKGATPAQQSRLFVRAGLPDLTTRRGMEEFSKQVQEYFEQLPGKGEGVQLPRKSMPSKVTGTPIPYTEQISQGVTETDVFSPLESGKPRRPGQRTVTKEYAVSDTKLRAAVRVLREMVDIGGKLGAPAKAALAYLRNRNRNSFGDALRDLAFDLAMFELDPKNYGANSTFYGEGGRYALDFRTWIEQNLDKNTVDLLNELIADHKASAEANAKFEQAISDYNKKLDAFAESKRQKAEKSGAKLPKAPKKARQVIDETPAGEGEVTLEPTVSKKNLPRTQGLYEIHPAIRRALEEGNTQRALELISEAKSNPYYAMLAQRLLEAGVTAKTVLIERDEMSPLNDTEEVRGTASNFIDALRDLIVTTVDQNKQGPMIAMLESNKLNNMVEVLNSLNTIPNMTDGQQQLVADARDFFNRQYGWIGKYDPTTDTVVMRKGVGMSNHTFLHEVVHAAASGLIDRSDTLQGVRRQGYDQLVALFDHTKGLLSQAGVDEADHYGLKDIHEFLSEALTNPEFQAVLRGIRYKGSPYSLMNWFTTGIRKLFDVKEGRESNVLNEVIFAADSMMLGGTAGKESLTGVTQARAMAKKAGKPVPVGRPNSKSAIRNLMTSRSWNEVKDNWPVFYSGLSASLRPVALGGLTLRQIADLVDDRIPQVNNFIRTTEKYLSRQNRILNESGEITKRWQRLQAMNPDMSRNIGAVMHRATLQRIDPDKATAQQRNDDPDLMKLWRSLSPEAKQIYRDVRNFYERRYNEYKRTLRQRVIDMRQFGVSEATINEIRNEFETGMGKGPYFPLMRFGRFWYQVGKGSNREYYMFDKFDQMQFHMRDRLAQDPHLADTLEGGSQYKKDIDFHAKESSFLKAAFKAIDEAGTGDSQRLKDDFYQAWLTNQPETSFRNRFVHRTGVEGFSQDALRNFASSAFHMAHQQARFEYSPDMFSQLAAAKIQLKDRVLANDRANERVMRENNELSDYIKELELKLTHILNPDDVGPWVSGLSNIGFIWYLTAVASAAANVVGGVIIGLPTLVGHQVRMNPKMSYTTAMLKSMNQMKTAAAEIMMTGFSLERGPRLRDNMVLFPSMNRAQLSRLDQAAYDRFVADGLIDITASYDQSGLASAPTESYDGIRHRAMTMLTALFHNAERFNREVIAMSAFRAGMEKRANYTDQQKAFTESMIDAKDVTTRSMFDYSTANKPRYMQSAPARLILQFKQFPQQMMFFLVRNLQKSIQNPSEDRMIGMNPQERRKFLENHAIAKREAISRFVGTMGMTAIFAGPTGLFGFSTVAAIVDAVMNGLRDEDEEEPFDFKLEFVNAMINTFGKNLGMFLTRGAGNAAGFDLHSRVSLDNMVFRDVGKNLALEDAWLRRLVDLMGPLVGLTVNVARAVDLYNKGHGDRALEAVSPAFIKQPLIAARYAKEGVTTLRGDKLVEEVTPFEVFVQSLGFRPADIAEIQYYNITKKGQEQEILKERQNLLNLYGMSFMGNDSEAFETALEKIFKYNDKHPTTAIPLDSLNRSVKQRLEKSSQAEHGLIVDKRLKHLIDEEYIRKLRE
jgi:hypothetical protein